MSRGGGKEGRGAPETTREHCKRPIVKDINPPATVVLQVRLLNKDANQEIKYQLH